MVYTLFYFMCSKRLCLAQYVNSLKQAGFSRTIVTAYQVQALIEVKGRTFEIPEICQAKLADRHARSGFVTNASALRHIDWHRPGYRI